jgi:N-acetylglucosaminyldiphosphoundecaprenol N-acetyl-beta-D-mannosaminyltransferase
MLKVRIGRALFDNLTMAESLAKIRDHLRTGHKGFIVTANVDNVLILERDPEFRAAYNAADMVLADGMPLLWASRILGCPLTEKVSGSDLVPELCRLAAQSGEPISIRVERPSRSRNMVASLRIR